MKSKTLNLPIVSIDGHWRVNPGAKLVLARNSSGFESLTLKNHHLIAIYSSFDNDNLKSILKHCFNWIQKQPESIISAQHGVKILPNDVQIEQVKLDETITVLDEILSYAKTYYEDLNNRGLVSSPNSKFLVVTIALSGEILRDSKVRSQLEDLSKLSSITSVRPILLIEDPRTVSPSLQKMFSWQGFLGKSIESYCRDKYTETFTEGMKTRVPIGLAINKVEDTFRVINSLSYEPTQTAKEEKNAAKSSAEEYKRFIEGLTDGKI